MTEGLAEDPGLILGSRTCGEWPTFNGEVLTLLTLLQLLIRSFNNANTVDTEVRSMNG